MSDDMSDIFDEEKPAAPEAASVAAPVEGPDKGDEAAPPAAVQRLDHVPIQAMLDERDKRQALQREAEMLREKLAAYDAAKQNPPPDLYSDPDARLKYENEQVERRLTNTKLEQSRWFANRDFGKEVVDAAFEYFNEHPELSHQFLNSPSPFHDAVEFYKRQKVADEVGTDPEAYKSKLRSEMEAEIREKLLAEMSQSGQPAAKPKYPGSLAAAPAAGKASGGEAQKGDGFSLAFGA